MILTIKEAAEWIWENRGIWVRREYLRTLCSENRLNSETIGRMHFISVDDIATFEFKKPGRPKMNQIIPHKVL